MVKLDGMCGILATPLVLVSWLVLPDANLIRVDYVAPFEENEVESDCNIQIQSNLTLTIVRYHKCYVDGI